MNVASPRKHTGPLAAILLSSAVLLAGCSNFQPSWEHRTRVDAYAQRLLSTRTAAGAEWLEVESKHDPTVRDFVRSQGRPDYLYVVDAESLQLFYPTLDLVAIFERGAFRSTSNVTRHQPIPKDLASMLPKAARQRIAAARRSRRR